MTEQFQNCKHGKTSVLEFLELTLLRDIRGQVRLTDFITPETLNIDQTDDGEHLSPTNCGETLDGGKAVGDIGEGRSVEVNITGPAVEFRNNVSHNRKHGDTSMFQFKGAPFSELLWGGVLGQAKRVEKAGGGDHTQFVLIWERTSRESGGGCLLCGGGESCSRGDKNGKDSELHDNSDVTSTERMAKWRNERHQWERLQLLMTKPRAIQVEDQGSTSLGSRISEDRAHARVQEGRQTSVCLAKRF